MNTIRALTHKADSLNLTHLHKYTHTQTRRGHSSVLNTQPSNTDTHLSPLTSYIAPSQTAQSQCVHTWPQTCILHAYTCTCTLHPLSSTHTPCRGANALQRQYSLSAPHGPLDQPGTCTKTVKQVNHQEVGKRQADETDKTPLTPFGRQFWAAPVLDGRTYLSSLEL